VEKYDKCGEIQGQFCGGVEKTVFVIRRNGPQSSVFKQTGALSQSKCITTRILCFRLRIAIRRPFFNSTEVCTYQSLSIYLFICI